MTMLAQRGHRVRLMIAAFGAATGLIGAAHASAGDQPLLMAQAQSNPSAPSQPNAAPTPSPAPAAPIPVPAAVPVPPTPTPEPGTPATVVDSNEVDGILGKPAKSPTGEDMGRIVDLIIGRSGQIRAAVIDFGGFLGVGSRKIAVDWRAVRFPGTGKTDNVVLDLTRNQLRTAPAYIPGEPVVVIGPQIPDPKPSPAAPPPDTAPPKPPEP